MIFETEHSFRHFNRISSDFRFIIWAHDLLSWYHFNIFIFHKSKYEISFPTLLLSLRLSLFSSLPGLTTPHISVANSMFLYLLISTLLKLALNSNIKDWILFSTELATTWTFGENDVEQKVCCFNINCQSCSILNDYPLNLFEWL